MLCLFNVSFYQLSNKCRHMTWKNHLISNHIVNVANSFFLKWSIYVQINVVRSGRCNFHLFCFWIHFKSVFFYVLLNVFQIFLRSHWFVLTFVLRTYVSVRLCTMWIKKTYFGKRVVVAIKTETISLLAIKKSI